MDPKKCVYFKLHLNIHSKTRKHDTLNNLCAKRCININIEQCQSHIINIIIHKNVMSKIQNHDLSMHKQKEV